MTNKEGKEALTAEDFIKENSLFKKGEELEVCDHSWNTVINWINIFASIKVAEAIVIIAKENAKNQVSEVAESRKENNLTFSKVKEVWKELTKHSFDAGIDHGDCIEMQYIAKAFNKLEGELVSTEKEIQPTMRTFEGHIKMLALEFEEAGIEYENNATDKVVNSNGQNTDYFKGKSDAYKYVKGKLNAALKWYGKATLAN